MSGKNSTVRGGGGRRRQRRRFTEEQRISAVRYLQEQRAISNKSWRAIGQELDVNENLLRRWVNRYGKSRFTPVEVTCPIGSSIVLTTAQGVRVEGLGIDELTRVLRALR